MPTRLIADGITKSYGRQIVLDGVSFAVHDQDRIGLIGRNGAGKTTLLKILAGQETADGGSVTLAGGTRLGILDQHQALPDGDGITSLDFLVAATEKPEWECRRLSARFGLRAAELELPPSRLSGGYQMRLKLVRLLLADPNVLLLDEPVNYLDLPTLMHLERFLRRWSGSFVVTSHDRELLRNLCTITWDVSGGRMTAFRGDVETYLDWREEQEEFARRTNKKLRREITHNQKFVDRFRFKASKASQAQSKIKHIARLRSKLQSLKSELPTAGFILTCPPFVSGTAILCEELTIGYGGGTARPNAVAVGINLEFPRGAKVGIVGENGRGKSTLLKTLAGVLPPLAGQAKWWHRADIGYFSQASEDALDPDRTVIETLTAAAPSDVSAERVLATGGAFLFRDDDLEKPCRVLSGGERSRLRLACLSLQKHNVLLLDEPTNHLDVETTEVVARALKEYAGTVVVVSHARTFMNALVEDIFEVRNRGVRRYPGTYEEYVAELSAAAEEDDGSADGGERAASDDVEAKRQSRVEERRRRRLQEKLEKQMDALEKEKGSIMMYFFENPTSYDPDKQRRLADIAEEVGALEREWLRVEEEQ